MRQEEGWEPAVMDDSGKQAEHKAEAIQERRGTGKHKKFLIKCVGYLVEQT